MNNSRKQEINDGVSYLQYKRHNILKKIKEVRTLSKEIYKIHTDKELYIRTFKLINNIYTELITYFNIEEEFLFHEIEKITHDHNSFNKLKEEHLQLLRLCNTVLNH